MKDPQINIILYFCKNHLLNTSNKNLIKINVKGQLEFNRTKQTFYLIKRHNAIYDAETDIEYGNTIDIENTIVE